MPPSEMIDLKGGKPRWGTVTYEKSREKLTDNERTCVDYLVKSGTSLTVKAEDPVAPANIDLEIDGELWEMKNVTNESSVSNQIKRTRVKWLKLGLESPVRAVFTSEGAVAGFDVICSALLKRKRAGERFLAISDSGELREI